MFDTFRFASLRALLPLVAGIALVGCGLFGSGDSNGDRPDGGVGDPCTSNAECGAAFVCAGGTCQLEGSVGLGGNCSANRDCGAELYCTPLGQCGPAGGGGVGDSCATGAECAKDLACELFGFGGTCQPAGSGDLGQACESSRDCLAGLACAADGVCKSPVDAYPPFTGAECVDEGAFRVYFEVPRAGTPPADFYRLPFPNDARVDATTGSVYLDDFPRPGPSFLGVDLIDLYVDALQADFRGWSSVAAVTFRFSGQLDFDSLENGANIRYIDVTPGVPEYASDRARSFSFTTGRGLYVCNNNFTIANEPHQPLRPGHTYAVYFTDQIRSSSSQAPVQDADFAALLSSTRPSGDPELESAWDQYQSFRDYLADQTINPATIAGAAVFTVADYVAPTAALSTAVQGTALPELKDLTLCDTGVTSPCADGGSRACGPADTDFYEVHGTYTVPIYQTGTPPYATPADGGGIVFNAAGVPQQVGTDDVCMVMMIPKTTKPVAGWPLAIYGHGTGGTFKGVVSNGVGRELASAGIAVFSWDGVVHGARRNGHPRDEDSLMFNVINPAAALYNNLQGAVDVMQAFRLGNVTAASVTGVPGTVDFDPANIFYFGHSQGSNVGIPALAVAPEPRAAVLSGAGGFLTQGILNKTSPVSAKSGLELLVGEEITSSHPMMTIWQTYFDPSDTVNFGPLLLNRPLGGGVTAKHILQTWSATDTYSPKATLNIMARSMQVNLAPPQLESIGSVTPTTRPVNDNKVTPDGNRTAVVLQYQAGDDYDGHFVAQRNANAVVDWLAFLTSAVGASPSIP